MKQSILYSGSDRAYARELRNPNRSDKRRSSLPCPCYNVALYWHTVTTGHTSCTDYNKVGYNMEINLLGDDI